MAFEETIRLVKETQKNVIATEEGVEKAKFAYDEISREVKNAKARLRRKRSSEHADVVARQAVKALEAGNLLQSILVQEITDVAIGTEFESDVYISKLYQVANDKDIYKLFLVGSGWNHHIASQIVFEESAGRLVDYARGIRAYRTSLKVKIGQPGSNRGLKATSWWLSHVYGGTLEESTVEGRVGISGRPAPFWSLLDKGSTTMPSDRPDSSYNPFPQAPTGFINSAELKINKEFDTIFSNLKDIEFQEADALQAEIETAEGVQESMKDDLHLLTADYATNQKVLNALGDKRKYADERKLAKLIRKLDENEKLPSRVSIGMKGKNLTISVKKLEGLIYD